jgi:hypothetical protein
MKKKQTSIIAYYLPQFHPIKENDEWWGKGFTEWTNVAKARTLFKDHYQPRVPADLGFYDLRLKEVRLAQSELAKEAGVSSFCYWHYWFGEGKELLEKPLKSVVDDKSIDFPFCVAWANHSWEKKRWNADVSRLSKELLIEQKYPGKKDIDDHFFSLLPAFKDKRYYKIQNKLVFTIYKAEDIPDLAYFINRWQYLAKKNGLIGFYFIGHTSNLENVDSSLYNLMDAINLHLLSSVFKESRFRNLISLIFKRPLNVVPYSKALYSWENNIIKKEKVYPSIYPNWDTTPRMGTGGTVLNNSTPKLFKKHVGRILKMVGHKNEENRVVFLKSWNEWAEGNYLEPDLKFGKEYIIALANSLKESENS